MGSCHQCQHSSCINGESGVEVNPECELCGEMLFLCSNDITEEQLNERCNGEACGCGDGEGPFLCDKCQETTGPNQLVGDVLADDYNSVHTYFDVSFRLQVKALNAAIKTGNIEIVKCILYRGYPGVVNDKYDSPIKAAKKYKRDEIMKILLQHC